MSQTRSRSKATATVTPQQDDSVAVTWVFFDASRPNNNPLPINVPRSLFNGNAHACRGFFAAALWDEFAFKAQKRTIAFWKVGGAHLSWSNLNLRGTAHRTTFS